jgi:4-amino-4-deoxy-L-arabinose transferase-like glycosyltransferase
MRLYFGRDGRFRGYSTGLGMWIAIGAVIAVFALALGYQVFMLAPVLAVVALAVWAVATKQWRPRPRKPRAGEPQ